jgi:DNA ligase (NAD+)
MTQRSIFDLMDEVEKADKEYHDGDDPSLSDAAYDALKDEIRERDPDNPILKKVGQAPTTAWPKVNHSIPMGSLEKVNTDEQFDVWAKTTGVDEFCVSEKLDGISISLKYEGGWLVQAVTRGDGEVGEDITSNVLRMKGFPHKLDVDVTVRGEIILRKSDFEQHFQDKKNTRNAAAGTAKRFDGARCEHLTIVCYQVPTLDFDQEGQQFHWLEQHRFETPFWRVTTDPKSIVHHHDRDSLDYDIDGMVITVNDMETRLEMGEHDGRPKGARAYKFASPAKVTIARGIENQVGGTGRITPVAIFEPVELLGATVTQASLYNYGYVTEIGFAVGATILVKRANDVIPRVEEVIESPGSTIQPPTACPECGAPLEQDGEYLVCPNTSDCPAQIQGRLLRWIQVQGIMEWGEALIELLVSTGKVRTVADLYKLDLSDISNLPGMGARSAEIAHMELWKVNPIALDKFLGGLSIPLCGASTFQPIIQAGYDTVELIQARTASEFEAIPTIGPTKAATLSKWFKTNHSIIQEILDTGVKIKAQPKGALSGKSLCITGKTRYKRAELEAMAEAAGATVKKSVSRGLTFLVMADPNSTSSKARAARKNGTDCISEDQLLEMLGK